MIQASCEKVIKREKLAGVDWEKLAGVKLRVNLHFLGPLKKLSNVFGPPLVRLLIH